MNESELRAKEYDKINTEIINKMNKQLQIVSLLYGTVGVILAFAVNNGTSLMFLIPFCAIIPIYLLIIHDTQGIYKLGSYLVVFHESLGGAWETRLHAFNTKTKKSMPRWANNFHFPFIIVSIFSLVLFLFYFDWVNITQYRNVLELLFALVCFSAVIAVRITQKDVDNLKEQYITEWKQIKDEEITKSL